MVVEIRMHIDPKPQEKFVSLSRLARSSFAANKASFRIREDHNATAKIKRKYDAQLQGPA